MIGAIGRGIRASLRFDAARRAGGDDAPGLLVLGPRDEVELITPPAHELLASIRADAPVYAEGAIAAPVLALASFVRGAPAATTARSNVVAVPGKDGWIMLHASLPGDPGDRRVAIVIERAGGVITTWDGGPAEAGGQIVAAGDARLHKAALALLRK